MVDQRHTPPMGGLLTAAVIFLATIAYFAGRSGGVAKPVTAATAIPVVDPVGFAAVGHFQEKCEHCHGSYGAIWSSGLSRKYEPSQLRQMVEVMCAGPGAEPLDGPRLEALVSYIRSLADCETYLAFTARDAASLSGEVTPGSKVHLIIDGRRIEAQVRDHQWTAAAAPTHGPAELVAERDGKSVRLDLTTHNSTQSLPAAYPAPAR